MELKELSEKYTKKHEGLRLKLYKDTKDLLSIGWGRNIEQCGISEAEAQFMFDNDMKDVMAQIEIKILFWNNLSDTRKVVLIDMAYNLKGRVQGLLKFKNMLEYSEKEEWSKASVEILRSKYAKDVPNRALENAKAYESDTINL